jgi:glycogen synthase
VGLARESGSLRAPTPEFLCLGRLSHEKGLDLVLTAFAQVVKTHATTRLVIAGDGPARHLLERQAWELGLSERVTFTGTVSDGERVDLFGRALAVLMPSRHREGFGLVALEAAQHGRAVIAARAGALSEAVSLLENGLLIPQEDAAALAAAMTQLLLHPEDAQRMGAAGQSQAALLFSQEACAANYSALYVQLRQSPRVKAYLG